MGRIAIFTEDPGWHGARLRDAFSSRGYNGEYVSLLECSIRAGENSVPIGIPGFTHELPMAAFVRGVPGGSLQEVVFYLDVLHALKQLAIPVYNDALAIERSVDKGMTSFLLHHAGIATPPTWVVRDRTAALRITESELKNGHSIITKPLFGSQGEGLRRIEKMTDLFWLTACHGIYYLQRYIACDGDGFSDWRIFVINGEVVACMRRNGVCWLNNVARGASCEAVAMEQPLCGLALQAVKALAMDYAGVDIIRDRDARYWVIEVNSIPAWKGLQSVCHIDVAGRLADDLITRYLSGEAFPHQSVVS